MVSQGARKPRYTPSSALFCSSVSLGSSIEELEPLAAAEADAGVREWVNVVYKFTGRGIVVFAYANNHYAGHGPATVRLFEQLLAQAP